MNKRSPNKNFYALCLLRNILKSEQEQFKYHSITTPAGEEITYESALSILESFITKPNV